MINRPSRASISEVCATWGTGGTRLRVCQEHAVEMMERTVNMTSMRRRRPERRIALVWSIWRKKRIHRAKRF